MSCAPVMLASTCPVCRRRDPCWACVAEFIATHPGGGTLEEVAALFGVTREAIRVRERKALRKLRHAVARMGLDPDLVAAFTHARGFDACVTGEGDG